MTKFVFSADVVINKDILRRKAIKALNEYSAKIGDEFQEQIEADDWAWTNKTTKRRNGQEAGNPRDIVDTGELRDSQRGPLIGYSRYSRGFEWTAEHAALVREGYLTKSGTRVWGRDWVATALQAIPFSQFIARRMRS